LDNELTFDPVILIGKKNKNLFFTQINKNLIIIVLVVTNHVPEVSVIREQ